MPTHTIRGDLCTGCGLCAQVCPCLVYERRERIAGVREDMAKLCVHCGHCMAICPTEAIKVEGIAYEAYTELDEIPASTEALAALLRRRRSIRQFKSDPVPAELLQQMLDAAATAPMGIPPSAVEVTVVSIPEQVAAAAPVIADEFEGLLKLMGNPFGRMLFRIMANRKDRAIIEKHLLPLIGPFLRLYREEGFDAFTWQAPAMMLFHAPVLSPAGETDCVLAATHAMLMAETLGLGTIMLGVVHHGVQQSPKLRKLYEIPRDSEIFNALAVGWPRYEFKRSIPRQLGGVHWVRGESSGPRAP